MPEPNQAPTAGEPAAPTGGDTPADGAANTPGDTGSAPTDQSPTPDIAKQLKDRFGSGFGKGAEKGRKEGAEATLETLGIGNTLDEALAWVDGRRDLSEAPTLNVTDTKEYREVKGELFQATKSVEVLKAENAVLTGQADTARVAKLQALAAGKGVGQNGQFDAFMHMHGDSVRFDSERKLEVGERVDGGDWVPTGQPVEEWLTSVLTAHPYLLKVDTTKTGGTGSRIEPAAPPAPADGSGDRFAFFGTPPPKNPPG